MRSDLHKKLQIKGQNYLANNQYWVRAMEMPLDTGIIDVWGISNVKNLDTAAIEVKVSRNDYRSLSQKYKELHPEHIANYCYLLCPEGLIKEHESPGWGIIYHYEKSDRLRVIRQPQRNEMTDRNKLKAIIKFFYSGMNDPSKLLIKD